VDNTTNTWSDNSLADNTTNTWSDNSGVDILTDEMLQVFKDALAKLNLSEDQTGTYLFF
jgi:hypothetical protein